MLLYKLGRTLQLIGLILLPVAMAGNLVPDRPIDERGLLLIAGLGVSVFAIGWALQQVGKE